MPDPRTALSWIACVLLLAAPAAPALGDAAPLVQHSDRHLVRDVPARAPDGSLNVVVEIPAGTNQKWEVDPKSGDLRWEIQDGKPRVVHYLPYPANYGMVPRTLGGDGDPLDMVLLGPAVPRGSVVSARLVGVLRLIDTGERDDKLVAVAVDGPLGEVQDLADLDAKFPGVTAILETWFANYKGPGRMESKGFADRAQAQQVLDQAVADYRDAP